MRRYGAPGLSSAQRVDMWCRWRAGYPIAQIARAFGRDHGSIGSLLARRGGIAPHVRSRRSTALTLIEREDISRGIASGESGRTIAARMGRAPSTISREIMRHGGRGAYRANAADESAWDLALRPKTCLLALNRCVRDLVASKLALDWSPAQISGWLKDEFPNDESKRVSHETIYRSLFIQARGVLKKELIGHLRTKRSMRRPHRIATHHEVRGRIPDAVSVRERPAEANDRAVPGHWEGDLISGAKNSHIVTLVERHSRFTALIKVSDKETGTVIRALTKHIRKLPTSLRRSLTWDRGPEMTRHKLFTVATNVKVFFCDPSSPWQRGSNENINGLLRQYANISPKAQTSRVTRKRLSTRLHYV
jgi:IS30 family transposase